MGFFDSMYSFGQQAINWVDTGIGYAKDAVGWIKSKIADARHFVDETMDFLHNHGLTKELALWIEESDFYQKYREIDEDLDNLLDSTDEFFDWYDEAVSAPAHNIDARDNNEGDRREGGRVEPVVTPLPAPNRPDRPPAVVPISGLPTPPVATI